MPLYSGSHCLICYKKEEIPPELLQDPEVLQERKRNAEVCHRFCTLASRYLDLDPFHFHPTKTIDTKRRYTFEKACSKCERILESYCEIYFQLEYLKQQLSWRAHEVAEKMIKADNSKKGQKYRQQLTDKLQEMGSNMEEIDDFRQDFIKSIAEMRKSKETNPIVKLRPCDKPEEDPDFIEIRVPKKDVQQQQDIQPKPDDAASQQDQDQESASPPLSPTPPDNDEAKESDQTSSEGRRRDNPNEDEGPAPKRKKASRKKKAIKIRADRTESNFNDSIMEVSAAFDMAVNRASSTDTGVGNDCSSSTKSESTHSHKSTVMIPNPNDNCRIENSSIKSGLSSECQADILRRDDETPNDDGDQGPVFNFEEPEQDGSTSDTPSDVPSPPSDNKTKFIDQFQHIQYKCPYPGCEQTFKTMTRMIIHRNASQHNYNAVIDIVLPRHTFSHNESPHPILPA